MTKYPDKCLKNEMNIVRHQFVYFVKISQRPPMFKLPYLQMKPVNIYGTYKTEMNCN